MKKIRYLRTLFMLTICSVFLAATVSQSSAQDFTVEQEKTGNEEKVEKSSDEDNARVVFTGTGTKKLHRTSPVKTDVVGKEKIEEKGANNLFEALNAESGILADIQCQNCAANTISINGLEGNYTQVLVDGYPVVSSLAGVYFFQQFPVQLIERVEVVKGAGSSLYGSGAIGGVVNVITRKPVSNEGSISYKREFTRGDEAFASTVSGYVSSVAQNGKAGIALFGSQTEQDEWDENGDGFTDRGRALLKNFGGSGYITLVKDMELSYNLISTFEDRKGGNRLDSEPFDADVREQARTNRINGDVRLDHDTSDVFQYSIFAAFARTKRETYYGPAESPDDDTEDEDLDMYGRTQNPFYITGVKGIVTPVKGHVLSIGYEYSRDAIEDENPSIPDREIDEVYHNTGLFAQYDVTWSLLNVIAGVRADKHSEVDTWQFSPRTSAIVNVSDHLRVRGTVATGFKAPQIFDEDFHIDVTLGGGGSKNQVIYNADDLEVERSISYSGDISGDILLGSLMLEAALGGFYTEIRDKFEIDYGAPTYSDANNDYYMRDNVAGISRVLGGNAEFSLFYGNHVSFSSGITWIPTAKLPETQTYANEETKDMLRVPEYTGFAMLRFMYDAISASVSSQIIGSQKVEHDVGLAGNRLEKTETFVVLNTRLEYEWQVDNSRTLVVFGGIDNITDQFQDDLDEGYERDAGYIYGPVKPRTYYLGCEMSF